MKSLATWKFISYSLNDKVAVMLMYVLESKGSSPGRQGFSMAVNAFADMEGTLGGGIMEHKFVEMAKSRLAGQAMGTSVHKQVHNKTAAHHQSGMICSGEQTILLYQVQKSDLKTIHTIIDFLERNQKGCLQLSPDGIAFLTGPSCNDPAGFSMTSVEEWLYKENIGYKNHLFIIGGGHCALALSGIMRQMDFYIHLFDDRKELKTMIQNNHAHDKKQLSDYRQLADLVEPGDNHYVVIMTFGYRTDVAALRALIDKKFKYLGLLGSRSKTARLLEDLKQEGYDPALLNRIHAPVGIPIKSQTPEEVAISIAAEIIAVKNENL